MSEFIDPEHGASVALEPCGAICATADYLTCTWPKGHAPVQLAVTTYDHVDGDAGMAWWTTEDAKGTRTTVDPILSPPRAFAVPEGAEERCNALPGEGGWATSGVRCELAAGHEGHHSSGPVKWGDPSPAEQPAGVRFVRLSELADDPDGAKILATLLGYDCGEGDACEQATPRPRGALDARVRILELPHYRGALVAGIMRAPFALVVDMLGTLEHVGAQEAFWTEHGKAMGAQRTIVAAGTIDLDGAEL